MLNPTELTENLKREDSLFEGNSEWCKYRNLYNRTSNLEELSFPIQLDFELNSACNLKCKMCELGESTEKISDQKLFDFDEFYSILSYSYKMGARAVKLNYINEPFLRKDIFKFIEAAHKIGILDIYLSTNGILLTKDVRTKIIESKLTRIQISIDASTSEVYDKIRIGGNYNSVVENVIALVKERKSNTPVIRVNFVKTDINEHQKDEFINFWKDKVDMIGIQEFITPPNNSGLVKSSTRENKISSNFKCSFPFKQLVITHDKKVLPCCTFWGRQMSMGLLESPEDLLLFWNNNFIKNLRKLHLEGRFDEIYECKNCLGGTE